MAASAASARHYFAFHEVTSRDNGNNSDDDDDNSSSRDDDCMRDRAFVELLHKWGLHVMLPSSSSSAAAACTTTTSLSAAAPHAPSPRWLLRRFRYTVLDDAPPLSPRATTTTTDDDECGARGVDGRASEQPQDTTSSRTAGAIRQQQPQSQLPYHDGLAHSLLLSLFDSATVQTLLGVRRDTHHHSNNGSSDDGDNSSNNAASTTTKSPAQPPSSSPPPSTCVTAVHYTPLRLRWTTLSPLRRLVDARVVRCVVPSVHTDDDNKHTANAHDDNKQQQHMTSHSSCSSAAAYDDDDEAVCMPVVKRPELLLPGDVVIADALRALFLAAHSRPCTHASAMHTGDDSDNDDDDAWCDACAYGYDDGDGDDDGVAVYALRRLRRVFARDERDELLYHVVWRLVAGGGALNQFDDDWAVYKAAARALLRTLVAGSVTAVATTTTTTTTTAVGDEDGDDACVRHASSHNSNNNNNNNDTSTTHYTPQLRCYAYAVHDVTAPFGLFRTSDGVVPSNLNYCYVIVHPAQQEVTLWYNSC